MFWSIKTKADFAAGNRAFEKKKRISAFSKKWLTKDLLLKKATAKYAKLLQSKARVVKKTFFSLSNSAFDAQEFELDVERQDRMRCPTVSQKKAGRAKTFFWCTVRSFVGRKQILLYDALFRLYKGGVSFNAPFAEKVKARFEKTPPWFCAFWRSFSRVCFRGSSAPETFGKWKKAPSSAFQAKVRGSKSLL